jgi:asparagine synthase (glutamine-hydrolysing)
MFETSKILLSKSAYKSNLNFIKNILEMADKLYEVYDLPFASESTMATLLVSKFTREDVTVALSGDGGDELYMGYGYYDWYNRARRFKGLGKNARIALSGVMGTLGGKYYRASRKLNYSENSSFWPHVWSQEQLMFNEREISNLLDTGKYKHQTLVKKWDEIDKLNIHPYEKISLLDLKTYLPENLLYKVDMASMGYGLEVRVPFLDHNIVQFAAGSPLSKKVNREKKYVLKKLLEKYISKNLVYRQKWGFPAPVKIWLNGPLKYLINKYLDDDLIRSQGLFNAVIIKKLVRDYSNGQIDLGKKIWALINFQLWYYRYFAPLN